MRYSSLRNHNRFNPETAGQAGLNRPNGPHMQMQVGKGFFKGQLGRRIRLGEGLGGKLWQSEEPLVVGDYHYW